MIQKHCSIPTVQRAAANRRDAHANPTCSRYAPSTAVVRQNEKKWPILCRLSPATIPLIHHACIAPTVVKWQPINDVCVEVMHPGSLTSTTIYTRRDFFHDGLLTIMDKLWPYRENTATRMNTSLP